MGAAAVHAHGRTGVALVADAVLRFGRARIRVTGASMLPSLWPGDNLTIERADPAQARIGEVVAYLREDRLFVHRVSEHVAGHLVTRGDALRSPDPPVAYGNVIGRVVLVERGGRPVVPGEPRLQARLASAVVSRSTLATRLLLRGRALARALMPSAGAGSAGDGVTESP